MKGSFTRYKILTWLLIFFSFNTFDIPFFWLPLFLMKCQSLILFIAPKCFVFSLGLVIVLAFNTLIVMDLCMISFVFSYMRFVKFLGSESYCSVANWRCSWPLFLQVFFNVTTSLTGPYNPLCPGCRVLSCKQGKQAKGS